MRNVDCFGPFVSVTDAKHSFTSSSRILALSPHSRKLSASIHGKQVPSTDQVAVWMVGGIFVLIGIDDAGRLYASAT